MTLENPISPQNAVCRRVIRVFIDRVRTDMLPRGRKTKINNTNLGNANGYQSFLDRYKVSNRETGSPCLYECEHVSSRQKIVSLGKLFRQ